MIVYLFAITYEHPFPIIPSVTRGIRARYEPSTARTNVGDIFTTGPEAFHHVAPLWRILGNVRMVDI